MSEVQKRIYGTMRAGGVNFGIAIEDLAEVVGPIKSLSPIMRASACLHGGLDRRGDLIPVLDPAILCGTGTAQTTPRFAVILRHKGRLLGLGTDEIRGLAQIADDEVKLLDCDPDTAHDVGRSAFMEKGQVTTVLDVARIFKTEGALSVMIRAGGPEIMTDVKSRQMLTFDAGGVLFSVLATEVFGTVPRQLITPGSMSGGMCLGTITYHERRIPVVSAVALLGLGRPLKSLEAEVVVLRFPDNRLVGFAVNAIKDIETMAATEVIDTPDMIRAMGGYLRRVKVDASGTQTFILDVEPIWQDAQLSALADLSDPPAEGQRGSQDSDAMKETAAWRERYLLFEAGEPKAVPLGHVVKIIPPPTEITPLADSMSAVQGFFSHGGQTIPLVPLSGKQAMSEIDHAGNTRVLLVGEVNRQVGFIVDRVNSIEVSDWTHEYQTGQSSEVGSLVQLGTGSKAQVFECIDLRAEAARHYAAFSGAGSLEAQGS